MTTITQLTERSGLTYSEILTKATMLEDDGLCVLKLLIYHDCSKNYVDSMDYGLGFPSVPYRCPHCKKQVTSLDALRFGFDVAGLSEQKWRELLDKEPLKPHTPIVDCTYNPPPYKSKFSIGDLVVNCKAIGEVSRIIEIDRKNIKLETPFGKEWVLDSDLRFIVGYECGQYPCTNLWQLATEELEF